MEHKNLTNIKSLTELSQTTADRIETALLDNHIHFINGDIDEESVKEAIKWLIYENLEKLLTQKK